MNGCPALGSFYFCKVPVEHCLCFQHFCMEITSKYTGMHCSLLIYVTKPMETTRASLELCHGKQFQHWLCCLHRAPYEI